jgi:hypothetical protein
MVWQRASEHRVIGDSVAQKSQERKKDNMI